MDDTFADEAGIPYLDSNADIPVHSTPIKGGNVPLPSTRHVFKKMVKKTCQGQDLTASESIQSIQLPDGQSVNRDLHPAHGFTDHGQYGRKAFMVDRDGYLDRNSAYRSAKVDNDYGYMTEKDNLRPRTKEVYPTDPKFDTRAEDKFDLMDRKGLDNPTFGIKSDQVSNVPIYKSSIETDKNRYSLEGESNHKNMNKGEQNQTPKSEFTNVSNKTVTNGDSASDTNHSAYSSYANSSKTKTWSKQLAGYQLSGSWDKAAVSDLNSTPPPPERQVRMETVTRVSRDHDDDSVNIERNKLTIRSPRLTRKHDSQSNKSTSHSKQNASFCELENSTLHKQRKEIQLLMSELKDRDRELSDMMSAHQQQLLAWEQDRQRLSGMEKKCSQFETELQTKSSKLLQTLLTLKTLKARETEQRQELQERRSTLEALRAENQTLQGQLTQEKTTVKHLKDKLESVSAAVGHLEAREEEMAANIKIKERDIAAATGQMRDLSDRLKQLDLRCKECQDREKEALKEKEDWRRRHEKSETERKTMSDELTSSRTEVNRLSEENRSARQQLALLQKEIGMREKCKDDLIESLKIKQQRTDSQLRNLRELYERQLKEVAMLQQQVDTSKEIIHRQQHSIDEQQFSRSYQSRGSAHISDSSMEKSAIQKSFQSTRPKLSPVQSSKYKEPDYDMQTSNHQSSGYQSQLSENQTGLVLGNQPTNGHNTSDQNNAVLSKSNQYSCKTVFNYNDSLKPSRPKSVQKSDPPVSDISDKSSVQKKIIFSEFSPLRSTTKRLTNGQPQKYVENSSTKSGDKNSDVRNLYDTRKDLVKTTQSQNENDQLQSPPRRGGFVIQQTHIELYPEQQTGSGAQPVSTVEDTEPGPVQTAGAQREVLYEQRKITPNDTSLTAQDKEDCDKEMAQEYVFENKLTSFLEDIDDIDDSIWDDVMNKSVNKSIVEGSPASKLQKLLLESRMMIQSLEKSAESPLSNSNTNNKSSPSPKPKAAEAEKEIQQNT